jgi:ATP-dependent DNA helicase PIF1
LRNRYSYLDILNIMDILLAKYRSQTARTQGIPAYCILGNQTLKALCENPPQTLDALLRIKGIGPHKARTYGPDLLRICSGTEGGQDVSSVPENADESDISNEPEHATESEHAAEPDTRSMQEVLDSLSGEQRRVIELVKAGHNVFMTGPGGTGKSFLIRLLVKMFRHKKMSICALTGAAAELLACQAKTIHSWAGTGLSKGPHDKNLQAVIQRKGAATRWKEVELLIVDEVSMLSAKYLEMLDYIGKAIRKSSEPFGGIQVVFSGDFYQLPPIGNIDACSGDEELGSGDFCFESPNWTQIFQKVVPLRTIFRQRDPVFTKILAQVRGGRISKASYDTLATRFVVGYIPEMPTRIYPKRRSVSQINNTEMDQLPGPSRTYESQKVTPSSMSPNDPEVQQEIRYLAKTSHASNIVTLKRGAHVMCVANIDLQGATQIVNGSQGVVDGFTEDGLPFVTFRKGLRIPMDYHAWMSDNIQGVGIKQIPLILSWAITIHKSQGVTLDTAIIDVGDDVFEDGQIYVALSRVKTLHGLHLKGFNPHKITTNPKVRAYYASLI